MKNLVTRKNRPTLTIHDSGRSTDFITPSFGYGCLYNCTYCYMKRHLPNGLSIAKNTGEILTTINNHITWLDDKPTAIKKATGFKKKSLIQTSTKYWTYDISCNEDFALHYKYHNWKYIFNFFKSNNKALGSFAANFVPNAFLDFNPEKKIKKRFSLMPQKISSIVEPKTSLIIDRINAINTFIMAGYDVHINFSPVILYKGWDKDYKELFKLVNTIVFDKYKDRVFAEVIFLTHNRKKHFYNLENNLSGESLLWQPSIQEDKVSQQSKSKNIRYKWQLKNEYINQFKYLHNSIIPWNTIRYCF